MEDNYLIPSGFAQTRDQYFYPNQGDVVMDVSNFAFYVWLLPVVLQIVLPLTLFLGWAVIKMPMLVLGKSKSEIHAEPALAS